MLKARDTLIYFSCKYEGDYHLIIKALRTKEKIVEEDYVKYEKSLEGLTIITIIDSDYPEVFKTINHPPIVLFLKGDASLLNKLERSIAVIGTREFSEYGKQVTLNIVKDLVREDFVIVSGMARGIDRFAHEAVLDNGGKTIAILGSGINNPYPASNKDIYKRIAETGLIISEYANMTKPQPDFFKFRNRIVAALSNGVLITEAKYRSGTLITVGFALERGCDIYCVPERVGVESGCNRLIKDGAYLVEHAGDIIKFWFN